MVKCVNRLLFMLSVAVFASSVMLPVSQAELHIPLVHPTKKESATVCVAKQIDRLENYLDHYGTIVAKTPDVWGESRMTSHRRDVEQQLKAELGNFRDSVQGINQVGDGAFLSDATNILAFSNSMSSGLIGSGTLPSNSAGSLGSTISTNNFVIGTRASGYVNSSGGFRIELEPTIRLDQKKRFLDHLNQLRRLNEGDDTADTPGYALHLVRVPVSVLPGSLTKRGYGAQVTCTAKPVLGEELLPQTFRDLVINDLTDLSSLPLVKMVEKAVALPAFGMSIKEAAKLSEQKLELELANALTVANTTKTSSTNNSKSSINVSNVNFQSNAQTQENYELTPLMLQMNIYNDVATQRKKNDLLRSNPNLTPKDVETVKVTFPETFLETFHKSSLSSSTMRRPKLPLSATQLMDVSTAGHMRDLCRVVVDAQLATSDRDEPKKPDLLSVQSYLKTELEAAYDFLKQPEADVLWSYAGPQLANAIKSARRKKEGNGNDLSIYGDYVKTTHLSVSTRLTNQKDNPENIEYYRRQYMKTIANQFPQAYDTTTAILGWWILVESSLLNEQLVEEMKTLASSKNAYSLPREWMQYYGPNPPPEARAAFNQYVQCRWPIQVFALDPATQDQNIVDEFTKRTELQIVLAVAARRGFIGIDRLMRYVRRIEQQFATIDINRTEVGFSHGADVFGWQFRPRAQTQEIESNATIIGRDLIWGGPSKRAIEAKWELEPGIRECTAIVLMPSFVPYVTIDTRSEFFKLDHHTRCLALMDKGPSLAQDMKVSSQITDLRCMAKDCFCEQNMFRDGEHHRLKTALDSLEAKLPLQTYYLQVPYENTLGGFDMFNSGVSDLAPRLKGFYGEPGIVVNNTSAGYNCTMTMPNQPSVTDMRIPYFYDCHPTELFLVGDNFSVHETNIIAGGIDVTYKASLISKQIIKVSIPPTVRTMVKDGEHVVDIHIATPHGVSNHLPVPVVSDQTATVAEAKKIEEKIETAKAEAVQQAISSSEDRTYFLKDAKDLKMKITTQNQMPVKYLTTGNVSKFQIVSNDLSESSSVTSSSNLKQMSYTPFDEKDKNLIDIPIGEIAFNIEGSSDHKLHKLGPYKLTDNGSKVEIDGVSKDFTSATITEAFYNKLDKTQVLKSGDVILTPFVRFGGKGTRVYPVSPGAVNLNVEICETKECKTCPEGTKSISSLKHQSGANNIHQINPTSLPGKANLELTTEPRRITEVSELVIPTNQ